MSTRTKVLALTLAAFACGLTVSSEALARRTYMTPEQQEHLKQVQTVLVQVIALTEKGRGDAEPLTQVVKSRMEEIGYHVVTDRSKPHDVTVKVKCEERKTWEGTTPEGGDADLPDSPSRLWKGPACQLTYSLSGQEMGWRKEVRTDFEDAIVAAQKANASDSGAYALNQLKLRLEQYDFPLLLAAEWGQGERLLKLLDSSETGKLEKAKILSVLSDMKVEGAIPHLKEALKNRDLASEVIVAMESAGSESIPLLADLMLTSKAPEIQAAAAKAIGDIGARSGDPRVVPPLLRMLERQDEIQRSVLIEVVWAIGKVPDKRAIEPIQQLEKKVWLVRDTSESMQKLREAVNWTIKQVYPWEHLS